MEQQQRKNQYRSKWSPKGYQKVIGSKDVYVKLGSLDELLYWRVIDRTIGQVGTTKQFYISPVVSPGYSEFIKDPKWQEIIREWSHTRNEYLKKNKC